MYNKAITITATNPMKSSQQKKFRRLVKSTFKNVTDDDIAVLFPSKLPIIVQKLSNRSVMYSVDPYGPLMFDRSNGKGDIFPTIYALQLIPHMLPLMWTWPKVSKNIIDGADLMLPGVLTPKEGFPDFRRGEKWGIAIVGNPCPIAVGTLAIDYGHIRSLGMRGKGMKVVHHYNDHLWNLGSGNNPPGFMGKEVLPIIIEDNVTEENKENGEIDSNDVNDEELLSNDNDNNIEDHSNIESSNLSLMNNNNLDQNNLEKMKSVQSSNVVDDNVTNVNDNEEASGVDELSGNEEDNDTSNARMIEITTSDMDEFIQWSFLYCLKVLIEDADLPLPASDLFSKYMLSNNLCPIKLDIKKSSYKKLSKLIKEMSKKNVINTKHQKDGVVIVGIVRSNPMLNMNLDADIQKQLNRMEKKRNKMNNNVQIDTQPLDEEKLPLIEVRLAYKVSKGLLPYLFPDIKDSKSKFSINEIRDALHQYIMREQLVCNNGKNVKLNDVLVKHLFKKSKQENSIVSRRDVINSLDKCITTYYAIVINGDDSDLKYRSGSIPTVDVIGEIRQGRRMVTKIRGFELYGINPRDVAKFASKQYACSASVQNISGKNNTQEILILGDCIRMVAEDLTNVYGVPSQYIHTQKAKSKKKKK